MDEHEAASLSVGDDNQGEFEVTGVSAKARWREVRALFFAGPVIYGAVLPASWLLWHRTLTQLTWIGLGLTAFWLAVLVWKHDLTGFSYSQAGFSEDSVAVFEGKRSPVPRELATPALVLAGVLLFLAGTSTGVGRWFASIFGVLKTLHEAGQNVVSILTIPLTIPLTIVVLLVFAGAGLGSVAMGLGSVVLGIYGLARFIVRGFRSDSEGDTGLGHLLTGIFFLAFGLISLVMVSAVTYSIIAQPYTILDTTRNTFLEPFRTIRSWFT